MNQNHMICRPGSAKRSKGHQPDFYLHIPANSENDFFGGRSGRGRDFEGASHHHLQETLIPEHCMSSRPIGRACDGFMHTACGQYPTLRGSFIPHMPARTETSSAVRMPQPSIRVTNHVRPSLSPPQVLSSSKISPSMQMHAILRGR